MFFPNYNFLQVAGAVGSQLGGPASSSAANRSEGGDAEQVQNEDYFEEVEEGIHATCRYSSFTKRGTGSTKWSLEDTRKFYKVG